MESTRKPNATGKNPTTNTSTDTSLEHCSICRDEENRAPFATLPCNHTFHSACITDWLALSGQRAHCPYCRGRLAYACGHHAAADLLQPGAVIRPEALAGDCSACGFKRGFAAGRRGFYRTVRLGATICMAMSEVYPRESKIRRGGIPPGDRWSALALRVAWRHVRTLARTVGGAAEFARRWGALPPSDHRRMDENTPGPGTLRILGSLRATVQAAAAAGAAGGSTANGVGNHDTAARAAGGGRRGADDNPSISGEMCLSPSRFPELYRDLCDLVLSLGYREPLSLVHMCEKEEVVPEDEDDEDEDEGWTNDYGEDWSVAPDWAEDEPYSSGADDDFDDVGEDEADTDTDAEEEVEEEESADYAGMNEWP